MPSITSLYDSYDVLYLYKIIYFKKVASPVRILFPINSLIYPTKNFFPFYLNSAVSRFMSRDPVYKLSSIDNKVVAAISFLINSYITINSSYSIVNSIFL